MERIAPPPPIVPTLNLSTAQINFLTLHVKRVVFRWQWYFVATQLRAHAVNATATIWRDELDYLVGKGLMTFGAGCADCYATPLGRAWVEAQPAVPGRLEKATT